MSVHDVGGQFSVTSFFTSARYAKIGSIGLVTQSAIGLGLFLLLGFDSIATTSFIPKDYGLPLFAYVGYLIVTLLVMSIVAYSKSLVKDKKCLYCGSALAINEYKCTNPLCGKEQ